MHPISYLSFLDSKNHDHFLLTNGHTMESLINTAGELIADWVNIHYPTSNILGYIGTGNNGKDILSAFQKLPNNRTYFTFIIDPKTTETDAYKKLLKTKTITPIDTIEDLPSNTIILDGIYGTGLNKPIQPNVQSIINTINQLPNHVISIDVPSGLSESENNTCINATITLSMMFPKKVFQTNKKKHCGTIYVLNFNLSQHDRNDYKFPNTIDKHIKLT